MKPQFTPGRILAAVLVVLLLAVVAGLLLPGAYTTEQAAERSFDVEEDFTKVRKIMVRTNAAKELVMMGGDSEFVEQQWSDGSAEFSGKNLGQALLRSALSEDPDWKLNLKGTLKVRTLSDTIGHEVIDLRQDVEIVPDWLQSQVRLKRGTRRLLGYSMTTRLARVKDHTHVELKLAQKLKIKLPWFAHGVADRKVHAAVEQSLAGQERAIRQLLMENADKAGLFPLH